MSRGPALALTMGEPAGIGGEIAVMAWRDRDRARVPPFFLIDDPLRLGRLARRLNWDLPIEVLDGPEQAPAAFARALPVVPQALAVDVRPGAPDPANGPVVMAAIETAVELTRAGRAAAVVTNPIHKQALYASGFPYPGHTEYLAALAGAPEPPVMLLACPGLRVVPVSVHLPLKAAIAGLTSDAIVHAGRVTAAALTRDLAVARPRLAVAGLNPHAGEGGSLGGEEQALIAPAVERLRADGLEVAGPVPADSLFHAAARTGYDAALCMYHDQALIPLKTIDFDHGVNVTLGLPFVRTSPDHGTAFDLAGTGRASPASLIAALKMARAMADNRVRAGLETPL